MEKPTYQELVQAIGGLLSILKDEIPMLGVDKINEENRIIDIAEKMYRSADEG